jgi:hypothetical protein
VIAKAVLICPKVVANAKVGNPTVPGVNVAGEKFSKVGVVSAGVATLFFLNEKYASIFYIFTLTFISVLAKE